MADGHAQNWNPIPSPTSDRISSCSFINETTGWITTSAAIYKTTDGGQTWTSQSFPATPAHNARFFNRVQFINENTGIIACGNYLYSGHDPALVSTILWTTDGGATWEYKGLGSDNDYDLDAKLVNETTAYEIGQYGTCKKTTDGGATWTDVGFNGMYSGSRLFPISQTKVYFSGLDNFGLFGAFGKTTNGGSAWSVNTISSNKSMQALYFVDANTGWIGGYSGEMKKTIDGGNSWLYCYTAITSVIADIAFKNADQGWAVTDEGEIIITSDGGATWNQQYQASNTLTALAMTPSGVGYAVGNNGLILKLNPNLGIPSSEPKNISIYPNPATSIVNIHIEGIDIGGKSFAVYNSLGQCVKPIAPIANEITTIDCGNLAAGVYFINLQQDNSVIATTKLVVR